MTRRGWSLVGAAFVAASAVVGAPPHPAGAADAPAPTLELRITDPRITESSGLAASAALPGVLWTVNDSGGRPQVYGIGSDGRTVATVTLTGATNRDWEAVAVGPRSGGGSWLWVGDIGDNNSVWPSIRVYRLAEPTRPGNRSVAAMAYDLAFPDGPRDAEALLVDPANGRLYVVSKRVQGAAVYVAPLPLLTGHINRLTRVASAPPLVTDGGFSPDGRVALRDYLQAWVSDAVPGPRERTGLPLLPQGESLTWTRDGSALLVGTEGENSEVWRVPVAGADAPTAEPTPTESDPSPDASDAAQQGSPTAGDGPSPWLVAGAGLVVGAAAAGIVAAVRRRGRDGP